MLRAATTNILSATKGAIYVCMSSSELDTLQRAFREAGGQWSTFVIWAKHTFTLGRSDYQRQYEPILYGWKDGTDHFWCGARDQGDVWFFDKPSRNDLHPTMKPVALVERAIRNSSKSRDIVLDPFGGSGTTMIAAERIGRRARLVELDPKYVDVAVQRWQSFAGVEATLNETGETFAEVAATPSLGDYGGVGGGRRAGSSSVSQPRGRPPHVPTKETQDMVESLSGFGIPQDEIGRLIGIDPKTLRLHYAEQIELGGIKATAKVAQNLFNMACKPTREGLQAAIFWLRVRAHWSEYSPRPPMTPEPLGKKATAEAEALTAGQGTEWGHLVN